MDWREGRYLMTYIEQQKKKTTPKLYIDIVKEVATKNKSKEAGRLFANSKYDGNCSNYNFQKAGD
jgi:hypothetical protein